MERIVRMFGLVVAKRTNEQSAAEVGNIQVVDARDICMKLTVLGNTLMACPPLLISLVLQIFRFFGILCC